LPLLLSGERGRSKWTMDSTTRKVDGPGIPVAYRPCAPETRSLASQADDARSHEQGDSHPQARRGHDLATGPTRTLRFLDVACGTRPYAPFFLPQIGGVSAQT